MLNFEFLQYYLPKTMITKYYLDIYLVLLLHHSFKSDFESTPSWVYPVLNFTGSQWFDRPLQTCGFWQMMWQEVGKFVQNQRFHGSDFINIFGHQFLWILWNTVSRIHKFVGNGFTNTCCCHAHFLLQWPFDYVDQLNNKSWCLTNIDDTLYYKKQCKLVIKSKDYFLEEDIWFLFSYLDFFLRAASL